MSMINDALRRASSAAKAGPETSTTISPMPAAPPPPLTATASPLPPVAFPPPLPPGGDGNLPPLPPLRVGPTRKKSVLPLLLVLAVLFCAAGAGGFYFWKKGALSIIAREKANAAGEEPTDNDTIAALFGDEQARAKVSAAIDRADAQTPTPRATAPVTAAPPQPPSRPAELAAVKPAPSVVVPQTPVKFPPLRLQSIFYRPSNPSVIINAKTLFIGDEVHGVTVAEITPSSVTLVLSGQTNVLTLR